MYLLAEAFPQIRRQPIPLTRDQVMLLLVAMNEFVLGLDTYLAHDTSGTIRDGEWVPIIFGPIAGFLLLVAGFIALRRRTLANLLASLVFLASMVVGGLGSYYHLHRTLLLQGPPGSLVAVWLLVYAPPLLGPLTFALVGIIGISAAWQEDPADSGRLRLLGGLNLNMPLSKTRAYFFLTALFILATLISSVLDHARDNFANPWLWLPTSVGIFSVLAATATGAYRRLNRYDVWTYIGAMLLMIVSGLIGAYLHVSFDQAYGGAIIPERFLRGAPLLAPLLYANMGVLGLIILLDPREKRS
jgi:hypothetical protein